MFSKWRHRDLHSFRKVTQLGTGTRMQIQESGASVWVPDPSLYHEKTSLGVNPHAEPQEDSMAASSLLVSLHGWPVPQTSPCIVSRRLHECGTSVHLLRPVLLTVFLCAHLNARKSPKVLDCSKERKDWRNSSFHLEAGPESCSVSPRPALSVGLWDQTVGRPRDCRWGGGGGAL